MKRIFRFVVGSLFLLALSWGILEANEWQDRGVKEASPLAFIYNGEPLRTLPEISPTEEIAAIPADSDSPYRFSRGEITTRTSEQTEPQTGLKIRTEMTLYSDFPEVMEWVAWFENVSDADTPNLRDILAADITLDTGNAVLEYGMGENEDSHINHSWHKGALEIGKKMDFSSNLGYPNFEAFPYFRIDGEKNSYIIAIGWTGNWAASFEAAENGTVRFSAGQKTVDLYLKPGEKFRTPRMTLFRLNPDADAVNLWRHWYREYIMPREKGAVLPPKLMLDAPNGGEFYMEITEEQQIQAIRRMREAGYPIEGLWIDAAWYLRAGAERVSNVGRWFCVGDWTPDPARLPNGFKPIADELGPDGDLTLWYEPERLHEKSTAFAANEKYTIPGISRLESRRMNMTSPETVAFLSDLIGNSIRENGVKIYRQDSNGEGPGAFCEHLEQTDPKFMGRKGMAENSYVLGYLTFWKNLKEMNPGLIIDSCASGGRRNDLDTLRMGAVPLHFSDVGYADFVDKQHCIDLLDQWFIYYKNIDYFDWNGKEYDMYQTTIDTAPFMMIRTWVCDNDTPTNRNYARRFLAVRDYLVNGDYYLLRGGFSEDSWTVSQYHDPEKNEGFLRVIRNPQNGEDSITLPLRGVDPKTVYEFENLDTGEKSEYSGAALLTDGITLAQEKRSGCLIRYRVQEAK